MPKLIAVIDDDPNFLALMRELLQVEEGYAVLLLHDESMAYERVREAQPDAIMVDIRLEHVDGGWLVLRAIRSDPALARTPVIVCSGDLHAIQGHAADLRRYHCVAIPKPFDLDDLLCTVARLITGRSSRSRDHCRSSPLTSTPRLIAPGAHTQRPV